MTQLHGRLQYPVWRSSSLVLMPGIAGGTARIDGLSRHDVADFATSLIASYSLDSGQAVNVTASIGTAMQDVMLWDDALRLSFYMGWNRRKPHLGYGFGVNISNSPTGTSIVPLFNWSLALGPAMHFKGVFPALTEFAWDPVPLWRVGIRQVAVGGEWKIDSIRNLKTSQFAGDVFVRRRIGPVALDVSLGWMVLNKVEYMKMNRSSVTIYGFDIFSSAESRSLPNRPSAVARVTLLFPGGEK